MFATPSPPNTTTMAATYTRISLPSANRHLLKNSSFQIPFRQINTFKSNFHSYPSLSLKHHNHPKFKNPFQKITSPNYLIPNTNLSQFHSIFLNQDQTPTNWTLSTRPIKFLNNGIDNETEVTVVLLGWLGAKEKHLRRYAELYKDNGFHSVTFVASVRDVLWFDFGKKLEDRVKKLAEDLAEWVSDNESGRQRFLIFHTFSNTGWLAYGAILDNLRARRDLMEKVRGCVVDSGGDPNIDPKVWAAGFTAALLKKSSSATYASNETGGAPLLRNEMERSSKMGETKPILLESALLFTFEKFFSYVLNLPDINRRLTKVISVLTDNQPPCPQLYLYSTEDKVIPFQAVESFIGDQRRLGKRVFAYDFGSSPHVDHYRTFPDIYAKQLHTFLKECLVGVGKLQTT